MRSDRREVLGIAITSPLAVVLGMTVSSAMDSAVGSALTRLLVAAAPPTFGLVIWTIGRAPLRATALWVLPTAGVLYIALAGAMPGLDELLIVGSLTVVCLMLFSERTIVWWIERTTRRSP